MDNYGADDGRTSSRDSKATRTSGHSMAPWYAGRAGTAWTTGRTRFVGGHWNFDVCLGRRNINCINRLSCGVHEKTLARGTIFFQTSRYVAMISAYNFLGQLSAQFDYFMKFFRIWSPVDLQSPYQLNTRLAKDLLCNPPCSCPPSI